MSQATLARQIARLAAFKVQKRAAAQGTPQVPARRTLEADWRLWLTTLFPSYVTHPFSAHQAQLWDWLWALTPGTRPQPFIGVWPRGSGKSTAAELGAVALGALRRRRYGLYVCHEVGTIIWDADRPAEGWQPVEQHPTAQRVEREGLSVEVIGLPMVSLKETVTPEHRYWARRVATRQVKHVGQETRYGAPHWIEARHLDWNTWIGHPIDSTVLTADEYPLLTRWDGRQSVPQPWPLFHDPDFWWVIGLWWGDGTLGGARRALISWSCGNHHPEVREHLTKILERWGYHPRYRPHPRGDRCVDVIIADSVLSRWLFTWKRGPSRKEPPRWVEQLPADYHQELIRGYLAADGHVGSRGASLTSIHLPGLLAVRRILARLGCVCHLASARSPQRSTFPGGRSYLTQRAYRLHIEHPATLGLAETVRSRRHELAPVFIRDGYLWSRVLDVQPAGLRTFVPIQTVDHTYLTAYGRSHNCSVQDQADDHVATIGSLLESPGLARVYPDMARRLVSKYGHSKGWRRNRLRTRTGFTIDALGLDTAARGAKLEMTRPDLILFDDCDTSTDSVETIQRKLTLLSRDLLPAGSADCAVLGIQNLIHPDGVFARLIDGRAEFLQDRVVSGPIPALEGLTYEQQGGRYVITGGTPTWAGQDVARCQALMDTIGLSAFRIECHPAGTRIRVGQHQLLPIEDLTPGMLVTTHEGRQRLLTQTMCRLYTGELITLRRSGKTEQLQATANHPFYVARRPRGRWYPQQRIGPRGGAGQRPVQQLTYHWLPAAEVQTGDFLLEPMPESPSTIIDGSVIWRFQGKVTGRRAQGHRQIEATAELFRLLGYYLAEGTLLGMYTTSLTFHENETEFQDDVVALFDKVFGVKAVKRQSNGKSIAVFAPSVIVCEFFQWIGCGSHNKCVPDWAFSASPDLIRQLIIGYMRGDGCKDPSGFAFNTVSEQLAEDIRLLMLRLGIVAHVYKLKPRTVRLPQGTLYQRSEHWQGDINGGYAVKLGEILGVPHQSHGRNQAFIANGYVHYPVHAIAREEVVDLPVYNCEVADDHSFLADGVSSHNCQHEATNQRGGMFDHLDFQHCDWDDVPPLVRVVVWCDPAVTNTDDSDCFGIQADGISVMGTIYRLWSWEDRTSPEDALQRAIRKAIELQAECCGVETDQGGEAWASVYSASARNLGVSAPPFRSAKAGAGHGSKVHRASQMLADYERGRIVHVVGTHEVLERALRRFPKFKPLDLVDSAYWAWNDLRQPSGSGVFF
jgi:LAGLIDADG DNA endonuclease family protein